MNNTARKLQDAPLYNEYSTLRDYLMQQTRWVTQQDITHATGLSGVVTRQICNSYPCLALGSTGGYRLAKYATQRDIQHAVSTLMNRSIKMLNRAQKLSGLLAR